MPLYADNVDTVQLNQKSIWKIEKYKKRKEGEQDKTTHNHHSHGYWH